jgi:hypothetical protein
MRCAARLVEDLRGPSCQFCGCATGESQQEDTLGIRPIEDKVRHAVG